MTFVPKDWVDGVTSSTPITAAALEDLEVRLASYAESLGGGSTGTRLVVGPTLPTLPTGTEYVWNVTDGEGKLLDIRSGVAE